MLEELEKLIKDFDGNVSLYVEDDKNNVLKINENYLSESASTIKLFILIEYYNQILKGIKTREDIIEYNSSIDYVKIGSGILNKLEGKIKFSSKNIATLMITLSDNIATNKMIEYLGFNNINNTIKELGLKDTKLICNKLDFSINSKVGVTTAYEYSKTFSMLINNEILNKELCNEIINILKNGMDTFLIDDIEPKDIDEIGNSNSKIEFIATKSGTLGDLGNGDIENCRNSGGIFKLNNGYYIISIFINKFSDNCIYKNHPANLIGSKISNLIYANISKYGYLNIK